MPMHHFIPTISIMTELNRRGYEHAHRDGDFVTLVRDLHVVVLEGRMDCPYEHAFDVLTQAGVEEDDIFTILDQALKDYWRQIGLPDESDKT